MDETGVLIVGAGPTGLTLACELARRGAPLRIVDQSEGPSTKVKASELQSRTLEVFEDMGVLDRAMELGVPVHGLTLYAEGRRVFHAGYDDLDAPFPCKVVCGQVHTERLLIDLLAGLGHEVERRTRVEAIEPDADGAVVTLRGADGAAERIRARYVAGCDGARSFVRDVMGVTLEGKTYPEEWILADVRLDWSLEPDEQYAFVSGAGGFTALTCQPLPHDRWQIGGPLPVDPEAPSRAGEEPSLAETQEFFDRNATIPGRLSDPTWLAIYRVHQRSVDHRVDGPLILAGDAAHLSSPVGGIGMNTGIQDAYNLGWKLALVLDGAAPRGLVDSYDAEREAVVRQLFSVSNRNHLLQSLRQPLAKELRNHVMGLLGHFDVITDRSYRDQSQTTWGYRRSPIVGEAAGMPRPGVRLSDHGGQVAAWRRFAGGPHAGDRAPDSVQIRDSDGEARRLYQVLAGAEHVLLLFLGCEEPPAETVAAATSIAAQARDAYGERIAPHLVVPAERFDADWPVILDPSEALHNRYGARGECLVLIRPDGYIGFRSQPPSFEALAGHLESILGPSSREPAGAS